MAGVNLSTVPLESSGSLHKGLNMEGLLDWLEKESKDSDCLIVSADALTSGGLIQARQALFDLDTAMASVKKLCELKTMNPNLKIYVFDTIMRTSITAYDEETQRYWSLVNKFSKALGLSRIFPSTEHDDEVKQLEKLIPKTILDTYQLARKKKKILNHLFCDMVHQGAIDYLILLQEDSMPFGVQIAEGEELKRKVASLEIFDRVSIYNGTDEGSVVLLAKFLIESKNLSPKVHLILSNDSLKQKIMPFEDRPLIDNYEHLKSVIGLVEVPLEEADYVLSIYTEPSPYDLDLNDYVEIPPSKDKTYRSFVKKTNDLITEGKRVAFVDLLYPNGGSDEILKDIQYHSLFAYSAWNTATNALGSCLALLGVHAYNPDADMSAFLKERIIDDCFYQTIVRRHVNRDLRSSGINIHGMTDEQAAALTKRINEDLLLIAKEYVEGSFKVHLPWSRTFEIDIDME